MSSKFAHERIVSKQKGRFKVFCKCGKMSVPKLDTEEEVMIAYSAHLAAMGIAERTPKVEA